MSDITYPQDAWVRLGLRARQRRISLGMSQPEVNAAGGPSTGVVSKIENARQTSYEERVLVQLERALQWQPGSAQRVLEGSDPLPVGSLPPATAEMQGTVRPSAGEEPESPITAQLEALLAQATRQAEERLAERLEELTKKVDESQDMLRKLLDERKGA